MKASPWLLVQVSILSTVFGTEASSWTIKTPSTVMGLPGSCMVIPCTYNFPDPPTTIRKFTGIWTNDTSHTIFHSVRSKTHVEYRNRTALSGDLGQKNCSLKIDPLRWSDQGPFFFRIEMQNYNSFSYSKNTVTIKMISQLTPISFTLEDVDNRTMAASCSVSHSCPSFPPVFNWSLPGLQRSYPHQLDNGQWTLASTLTFHPTHAEHKKQLQCTVAYRGGQQQHASRLLLVKYAPVKVLVEHPSSVREGESATMTCSCDSNPPADVFHWYYQAGHFLSSGRNFTMPNTSRHAGALFCRAFNFLGSRDSSSVKLNVSYPPVVKPVSSCFIHQGKVTCTCVVESSPPSSVHLLVSGERVPSVVQRHGDITMATLETDLGSAVSVSCQAENAMGRSALDLRPLENRKMKMTIIICFIAAGGIFVVVFTVLLRRCLRRSANTPPSRLSDLQAQEPATFDPACSSTSSSKGLCEDACEPRACSEHVYGNTEQTRPDHDDEDDAIYANV